MEERADQSEFESRREQLSSCLPQWRVDAFLTLALPNVRYLSGFTGSNGAVLILPDRAILFTDPRYATQAPREADCDVKIATGPLLGEVARWLKRLHVRTLGFEENRISYQEHQQLKAAISALRLKPIDQAVETIRMIKSSAEIGTIKAAVQLNSAALDQALGQFKPSMTELDFAAEIEYRMRLLGADGIAFNTIVASGPRTAQPHAHPTNHPMQADQLLLIDMGASVAGYASDMTRTYALGKINARTRRMYKAVLQSQLAAIEAIRPGVACSAIDRAARTVLSGYGFDKLFVHSTGHGLGLEIHERPRVGKKEGMKLQRGMVITVEPGVYQEGLGGVRIEDTVVVTQSGCHVLTPTGKELVVL